MKCVDRLKDVKIKYKLSAAFGMLVVMLIALAVVFGLHFSEVNKKYAELITLVIHRQTYVSKAIEDIKNLDYLNLVRGYLATGESDSRELLEIHENYGKYSELFITHLENYLTNIENHGFLSESESKERTGLLDEILYLFVHEYQPKAAELDAVIRSGKSDRGEEVARIIGEGLPIGMRISDKLDALYDMVSVKVENFSAETYLHSNNTILLLCSLTAFFVIIAVLVSLFMAKRITAPIAHMGTAMCEISKGNLAHPIRSERGDELGLLANQIGDMVESISEINKVITVIDNIDSMVTVIDLDYNLIYANRKLIETYGLDPEGYRGKKCHKTIRNLDHPCSVCQLHKMLPDKDSFPSRSYEFVQDDASGEWISGTSSIVKWVDGSMVYIQSVRNETEQKNNQERLREAMEAAQAASVAKSSFLANMSHEIRTPMNAVLGISDLLLAENLNKSQFDYVTDIKMSAMTLLDIINDILDMSKIQAGRLELSPVHYDFKTLVGNVGTITHFLIADKNVDFDLSVPDESPACLYGDDVRLRQVLLNLLGNAAKFTEAGYIRLSVGFTDQTVRFTVSDTGKGIREEDIPMLFDAFEQFDVANTRNRQGTGLGLAIVKSIVERMGGTIAVESVYGEGTSFHIEIPKILGDEKLICRDCEEEIHISAPEVGILIVDDNKINLNVASGLLRLFRINADTAVSGRQALELLGQKKYDIVFMDHRMPEMDGTETTRRIREAGITTPIIALTASVVIESKETMFKAGMNDYLAKPIIKAELINMLKKWLPGDKIVVLSDKDGKDGKDREKTGDDPESHGEFWKKIESMGDISTKAGLKIVSGRKEIYEKSLKLAIYETDKCTKNLTAFLSAGDMQRFRTEVHGIKGALANIGAAGLSGLAYELEVASGRGDAVFCGANLPHFLEKLGALNLGLKEAFATIKTGKTGGGPALIPPELRPIFEALAAAFEGMDFAAIDEEMKKLDELEKSHGDLALRDQIEAIKDAVLMMDYDSAVKTMQKIFPNPA